MISHRISKTLLFAIALIAWQESLGAVNLQVQVNPGTVAPGDSVLVELIVSNDGAGVETNITVDLDYPADMNDLSNGAISGGGGCPGTVVNNNACDSGEVAEWTVGTLIPGQSVTLSLPPVVTAGLADGTLIAWNATVSDGVGQVDADSATLEVETNLALRVAIDTDKSPVDAGDFLTYTLRYGNESASSTTGSTLTFPVPTNATFVSATGGGTFDGTDVSWSLGTMPAGGLGEQQVVVQVDNGLTDGDLVDVDSVDFSGTNSAIDTDASATHTVPVGPEGPLGLGLVVVPNPAEQSETLHVEMTVTNHTAATVFGATLNLRWPNGINDLGNAAIPEGGACAGTIVNNSACDSREVAQWTVGALPPGQSVTVSFQPVVAGAATNGALIPWSAWLIEDGNTWVSESDTLQVGSQALTLSIDEDNDPVDVGDLLTYTVRYGNDSAASVTSTTLTFPVPANTTFFSATNGGTFSGGEVSWALGTVPAGNFGEQQVVVQVNGGLADGDLIEVDYAEISGTNNFLPTQQRAGSVARVAPQTPLALGMVVTPNLAEQAETLNVEMTVTNRSAATVFGGTLNLRWPIGINDLGNAAIPEGGNCAGTLVNNNACDSGEVAQWTLGTLPPGQSVTVSFRPIIANAAANGAQIPWRAWLVEDNNTWVFESDTVQVGSQALTLSVDEDKDPVDTGDMLTYTLRYGNDAAGSTTGTTLQFPIPAGTTFVSATGWPEPESLGPPPVLVSDGVVSWDLGTLQARSLGQQQVVVQVDGGLANGDLIEVDYAGISGMNNSLPTEQRASNVARIDPDGPLSLAVAIDPSPASAADTLDIDLTVVNTSASTVFNAELQLPYPPGFNDLGNGSIVGGSCAGTLVNNNACDSGEVVIFPLGTMTPGQQLDLTLAPVVANAVVDGSLIPWRATVVEDNGSWTSVQETLCIDLGGFLPNGACPSPDSDADGVADNEDAFPANMLEWDDTDFDGIGNNADLDDDNDGLSDDEEAAIGSNPLLFDTDDDSLIDGSDNCPVDANANQSDADSDGIGDPCDPLPAVVQLPDINSDGTEDIAVVRDGSMIAEIRSGTNGALQKNITFFDNNFTPIAAVALPDSDGNGVAELGVLASRNSDGRAVVQVRNITGAEMPRFVWFAANHRAIDIAVVDDDADNNGVVELAVLSRRNSDGRGLVEVKNAFGATNPKALWAGAGLTSSHVEILGDKDANGVPEVAILSTRDSDGRIVAEIKNAAGATLPTAVWFAPGHTAIDMVAIDDKDANGVPEVAVLSRRDSDGRNVVEIKNAAGPTAPSAVWFAAGHTATDVRQVNDADGNSVPEVAVLSTRDSDGRILVEVKNVFGATNPNPVWYSPGFTAHGISIIADTDANGIEEALVLMIRSSDGRILVEGRNAAGNPAPNQYWFSP